MTARRPKVPKFARLHEWAWKLAGVDQHDRGTAPDDSDLERAVLDWDNTIMTAEAMIREAAGEVPSVELIEPDAVAAAAE